MAGSGHRGLSKGVEEAADGGDRGVQGPKDGIALGMVLVLNCRCWEVLGGQAIYNEARE